MKFAVTASPHIRSGDNTRRLMLDENKNVTEASLDVGYESTSQFIRDYRKMFGLPPGEDIGRLRGDFSTKKFSVEN